MFEVFLFFFLGVLLGIIAGLIPGIHPNFIAIVASSIFYNIFPNNTDFISFIVAMGVTNSFISTIPSILLGAPEDDNFLTILPGHYFLLKGYGYYAIKLTIIGSMFGFLFCLITIPITYFIFPKIYSFIKNFMAFILCFIAIYTVMLEREKRKIFIASVVFILSGIIGILGNSLPIKENFYLFVALTGLFGLPNLILSIKRNTHLPQQHFKERKISIKTINKSIFTGSIAGLLTGLLPGVGASHATVIATLGKISPDAFLISIGAATTSNVFFSFLALWLIGKPRSGLAITIKEYIPKSGLDEFLLLIIISLLASSLSTIIGIWISKKFVEKLTKIDYRKINIYVMLFLIITVWLSSSFFGIFLLIITTSLGVFAVLSQVKRVNLMGFLILPTILFFFNAMLI